MIPALTRPFAPLLAAIALWAAACDLAERPPARAATRPASMPFTLERLVETYDGPAREVLQVPGYTYVAIEVGPGDVRWTASLEKRLHAGDRVRAHSFGVKRDFESRRLARRFAELRFAALSVLEVAEPPAR